MVRLAKASSTDAAIPLPFVVLWFPRIGVVGQPVKFGSIINRLLSRCSCFVLEDTIVIIAYKREKNDEFTL